MTPQSVRNYLSGVKLLHILLGFNFPFYEELELKLTLWGLDRLIKQAPSHAPPVSPELLRALLKCARPSCLKDLVFSCAFLFAFFLFARISNLAPVSVGSFDTKKHLCRGDIIVTSFGLLVTFKWSKTNQTGAQPLTIPLLYTSDPHLCPVRVYLVFTFAGTCGCACLFHGVSFGLLSCHYQIAICFSFSGLSCPYWRF